MSAARTGAGPDPAAATRVSTDRGDGAVGALVGLVAGVVVLAPVLGRGYVLSYDMVFVPDPPITPAVLGTDGSVPRAVPTELVADLLAAVLPAWGVQQALLLAVFVLAGAGVARLVPSVPGAAAAALVAVWNPYVAERLVIGHWTFLLGYALLPWVVAAARRDRLPVLLLWLGAAALAGSTSALLATGTAVAVLATTGPAGAGPVGAGPVGAGPAGAGPAGAGPAGAGPAGTGRATTGRAARVAAALAFSVLVNASWLVPGLTRPGGVPADPTGLDAFTARADTPLGLVGSLLTLGGIWNPAAVPAGRDSVLAVVALAGVAAALALGGRGALRTAGAGLAVAAATGLVLAAAGAVPGPDAVLRAVVVHVPGGGLLRDSQKLLAPAAVLVAVAAGHAVARLAASRRTVPYAVLVGVLPVLALPGLAWGVGGRLGPSDYPPSWTALRAAAGPGEVASLPWTLYRRFDWAGDRVVLDPLPRALDRPVLVNDDLPLSGRTVRGEDARAAAVTAGLARGRPLPDLLRAAGARWAVVHRTQPGAAAAERALAGLPVRLDTPDLLLVELPGPVAAPQPTRPLVGWLGLGLTAAALAGAGTAVIAPSRDRRLLQSPDS